MPATAPNLQLLIFILLLILSILHHNPILLIPHNIPHPHFPRWQLPPIRLQRLKFRILHIIHVFAQMLYALHNRLTLHVCRRRRACRLPEHFVRHEGERVGALEQDVEGGLKLEDGLEN
jgi:hypothetical protein